MPRSAPKFRPPDVRRDGEPSGTMTAPGQGQPNGRMPGTDVPTGLPYGERGQLTAALAATPPSQPPPGISPAAHGARQALSMAPPPGLVPLDAPTQRPDEPVTAGAPLAPGPTNPAAAPQTAGNNQLAQMLQQIAQASGSGYLMRIAQAAADLGQ